MESEQLPTGLTTVTLQPGESYEAILTFTTAPGTSMNTILQSTITATYGPAGDNQPREQSLVQVVVGVPAVSSIGAVVAAWQQINSQGLVDRFNDLRTALTNWVLSPSNGAARSQALGALDAIIRQLPFTKGVGETASLQSARDEFALATTSTSLLTAANKLAVVLERLADVLTGEARSGFTWQLDVKVGDTRRNVSVFYPITISNNGTDTTTYDFTVEGLPSDVTATFDHASVTLAPGQTLNGGPDQPLLILTPTGDALPPTTFIVRATARNAPSVTRTDTGLLVAVATKVQMHTAFIRSSFVDPGEKVEVRIAAVLMSYAEVTFQHYYDVVDEQGNVIFTSSLVTLTVGASPSGQSFFGGPLGVRLPDFDTTGLPLGNYQIRVYAVDLEGRPLSDSPSVVGLFIGSPINAVYNNGGTTFTPLVDTQSFGTNLTITTRGTFPSPLELVGAAQTTSTKGYSIAVRDTYAYLIGLQRLRTVITSSEHKIEPKVAECNATDLVAAFPCPLGIRGNYGVTEAALIRVGVQEKNPHALHASCRATRRHGRHS